MNPRYLHILKKLTPAFLVVLFIVSIAGNVFLGRSLAKSNADPELMARKEMQELVEIVGQLMVLPEGEDPTIATVADPEKLKDQEFFAHAQVGDKVLLYTNAKKAILYSPTSGKIVEVAPINIGDAPAVDPAAVTETP